MLVPPNVARGEGGSGLGIILVGDGVPTQHGESVTNVVSGVLRRPTMLAARPVTSTTPSQSTPRQVGTGVVIRLMRSRMRDRVTKSVLPEHPGIAAAIHR